MIEYQEIVGDEMFGNRACWVAELTDEDTPEVRSQVAIYVVSIDCEYEDEITVYMDGVHQDVYYIDVKVSDYLSKEEFNILQERVKYFEETGHYGSDEEILQYLKGVRDETI